MTNRVQMVAVVKEPIEISCRKCSLEGFKVETLGATGQKELVMVTSTTPLEVGKCYEMVGEIHSLWACVNDMFNVFVVVQEAKETTEDKLTFGCQVVLEGTLQDKSNIGESKGKRCVEIRIKQFWEGHKDLPLFVVKCWYEAADVALATAERSIVRINGFLFSRKRRVGVSELPLIYFSSNTITVLKTGDSSIRERLLYAIKKQELQLSLSLLKQVKAGQERVTKVSQQRLELVNEIRQMGFGGKLQGPLADPSIRDSAIGKLVEFLRQKSEMQEVKAERFSESLLHAWLIVLSWNEYKDVRSKEFEFKVWSELTKAMKPDWETGMTFSRAIGDELDKQ